MYIGKYLLTYHSSSSTYQLPKHSNSLEKKWKMIRDCPATNSARANPHFRRHTIHHPNQHRIIPIGLLDIPGCGCRRNGTTLSIRGGLAIITHARLKRPPRAPKKVARPRHGGSVHRTPSRPHARRTRPDRIYQPTRRGGVKDKKTLGEATRPTRPPPLRARQGCRTLGPRPRIPRIAHHGMVVDGGGAGARGRGRAD